VAWHGEARQGAAWQGEARRGWAGLGTARQGEARLGEARLGEVSCTGYRGFSYFSEVRGLAQNRIMEQMQGLARQEGYLVLAAVGAPLLRVPVTTADQAVAAWQQYRDGYGLGASHLKRGCGEIRSNAGALVARVSYNGRVWAPDGRCLQDIDGGLQL